MVSFLHSQSALASFLSLSGMFFNPSYFREDRALNQANQPEYGFTEMGHVCGSAIKTIDGPVEDATPGLM